MNELLVSVVDGSLIILMMMMMMEGGSRGGPDAKILVA
jgi:hypothetical protein